MINMADVFNWYKLLSSKVFPRRTNMSDSGASGCRYFKALYSALVIILIDLVRFYGVSYNYNVIIYRVMKGKAEKCFMICWEFFVNF